MTHSDIEQLLVDIHAAKAFLDRVEFGIRNIVIERTVSTDNRNGESSCGSHEEHVSVVAGANPIEHTDAVATTKGEAKAEVQPELFDLFGTPEDKTDAKDRTTGGLTAHQKGLHTLTRRQVLANFREIVGDRKILDLADVNRIFGYNKSTSGTFVKHAIKRGELGTIPYGAQGTKFLMIDVRRFIKQHFDRIEEAKIGGR